MGRVESCLGFHFNLGSSRVASLTQWVGSRKLDPRPTLGKQHRERNARVTRRETHLVQSYQQVIPAKEA